MNEIEEEILKFGTPVPRDNDPIRNITRRFCRIASEVREQLGGSADCFCGDRCWPKSMRDTFRFDEEVIAFIESAVQEKLKSK